MRILVLCGVDLREWLELAPIMSMGESLEHLLLRWALSLCKSTARLGGWWATLKSSKEKTEEVAKIALGKEQGVVGYPGEWSTQVTWTQLGLKLKRSWIRNFLSSSWLKVVPMYLLQIKLIPSHVEYAGALIMIHPITGVQILNM